MKTNSVTYILSGFLLLFLMACSTKKDKLINREFQALNTKFNVLYNGNVALEKGIVDLKLQYKDDYWKILPVERMIVSDNALQQDEKSKNTNFALAEEKATKAIQKRSMYIDGKEKNSQIDEAHILLGKSRYYEQRFVPALEAFNYILFKYPDSDKIYEAKIWREKTNMRLDNDALAVQNLRKLLKEIKFKDQIFADANAALTQAFINLELNDSAVVKIKLAREFTKSKEEKARYAFILAQLYEKLNYKDSAFAAYQSIIDMKRKSPKAYAIHAHERQSLQFDYANGDSITFLKKYEKLFKDRENRPHLDQLNYQMAMFYDNQKKTKQAEFYFKKSLRRNSADQYLVASDYRNLAKINFDNAKYKDAGMYYDSTLTRLTPRTREFNAVRKKRENLNDVIKYETIAQQNDSILKVVALLKMDQIGFYETYISKIKKADEAKAKAEKLEAEKAARLANDSDDGNNDNNKIDGGAFPKQKSMDGFASDALGQPNFGPKNTSGTNEFYFYNAQTVAYGKLEFKKKWGNRPLKNNWRLSGDQIKGSIIEASVNENTTQIEEQATDNKIIDPKYTSDFYIQKLPTDAKIIADLNKERNFAYYQLGVIYKEKFKEYQLAASKLEQLLANKPEERLVLPAMYNLFKIYEIIDIEKSIAIKNRIVAEYPTSRYTQIISNPNAKETLAANSPETIYASLYKTYESGNMFEVLEKSTAAIDQFTGEEMASKFELLKANAIGKLQGLEAFKKALNFVALNYPNVAEGKNAEQLLADNVPKMEALQFYQDKPSGWKILYQFENKDSIATKPLIDKIKKFTTDERFSSLKYSVDNYNMTQSFIVIRGLKNEELSQGMVSVLKEFKEFKVQETAIVISTENYKIVQIKKNLQDYLTTPKTASVEKIAVPIQNPPIPVETVKQIQKNNSSAAPTTPNGSTIPNKASDLTPEQNLKMIQEKMKQNAINNQQTITPKRP